MSKDRNPHQIIRKDAKNCFVESLSDAFGIDRFHFAFAAYDMSRPSGQRQTNNIHIYIAIDEFLELCRRLESGELWHQVQNKRKSGDKEPLYQCLGGTSAEKLAKQGRSRSDGMSLSRTARLLAGSKSDFLFVADSGPGQANEKGLIVPRFGNHPENHVTVSLSFEMFSRMMLLTKLHYEVWLLGWYIRQWRKEEEKQKQEQEQTQISETLQSQRETEEAGEEVEAMF